MASTYSEQDRNEIEANRQIFVTELLNNLDSYKDNMLYDDISNPDGEIAKRIFQYLLDKQEIDREALLKIFAECNSYIVGFEDKDISEYLNNNISQMIYLINTSYKVSKIDFIWKKKFEQNKKNMGKQLKEVSRAIKKMANEIEEPMEEDFQKENLEMLELLKAILSYVIYLKIAVFLDLPIILLANYLFRTFIISWHCFLVIVII